MPLFQLLSVTTQTERVLEKNSTGHSDCLNEAAIAQSNVSVSGTEGWIVTAASAMLQVRMRLFFFGKKGKAII